MTKPYDLDVMRKNLRKSTAELLKYDVDNLTPAQSVRLDRACMLRLEIDDIETAKLNNQQQFDVKAYVVASEALERLTGGNPEAPAAGHDFSGARKELFDMLDRLGEARERQLAMDPDRARRKLEVEIRAAAEKYPDVFHPDTSSINGLKPAVGGDAQSASAANPPLSLDAPVGGSLPVLIDPPQSAPTPQRVESAEESMRRTNENAAEALQRSGYLKRDDPVMDVWKRSPWSQF